MSGESFARTPPSTPDPGLLALGIALVGVRLSVSSAHGIEKVRVANARSQRQIDSSLGSFVPAVLVVVIVVVIVSIAGADAHTGHRGVLLTSGTNKPTIVKYFSPVSISLYGLLCKALVWICLSI